MKRKMAMIKAELVDESRTERNEKSYKNLLNWFREFAISVPWVKDVKNLTVEDC
jgi:hypothetical protein